MKTERDDQNFLMDFNDPNQLDFRWVRIYRARLHEILAQVAAMAYAPQPLTPAQQQLAAMRGPAANFIQANMNALSREEKMKENLLRNPKLLDDMIAVSFLDPTLLIKKLTRYKFIQTSMTGPTRKEGPVLRLVIDLLAMEDSFEAALAVEHAEDKLINKQFSVLDEGGLAKSGIKSMLTQYYNWIRNADPDHGRENDPYKMIEEISLINRSRRNFRLLRDWTDKRPW